MKTGIEHLTEFLKSKTDENRKHLEKMEEDEDHLLLNICSFEPEEEGQIAPYLARIWTLIDRAEDRNQNAWTFAGYNRRTYILLYIIAHFGCATDREIARIIGEEERCLAQVLLMIQPLVQDSLAKITDQAVPGEWNDRVRSYTLTEVGHVEYRGMFHEEASESNLKKAEEKYGSAETAYCLMAMSDSVRDFLKLHESPNAYAYEEEYANGKIEGRGIISDVDGKTVSIILFLPEKIEEERLKDRIDDALNKTKDVGIIIEKDSASIVQSAQKEYGTRITAGEIEIDVASRADVRGKLIQYDGMRAAEELKRNQLLLKNEK